MFAASTTTPPVYGDDLDQPANSADPPCNRMTLASALCHPDDSPAEQPGDGFVSKHDGTARA
jgi:hypothetical protein